MRGAAFLRAMTLTMRARPADDEDSSSSGSGRSRSQVSLPTEHAESLPRRVVHDRFDPRHNIRRSLPLQRT